MKVLELMERAGITGTGKGIMWIKDALEEIALESPTHIKRVQIDIENGKRFYDLPKDMVRLLDIRCKHHKNTSNKYESIPRTIYEPQTEDTDGI
tara:strand:+ start:279 stop:560 length:282 start_codon:yes stop_codon:yes gene_type:complete